MKKLTKIIALVLALVCICTAFAACGGNKDDKDKEKTPAVKVINYDLTSEQYAFGVDKDQPELLTKVNEILKEMKSDGTFDAICNNNFGSGTPQAVKSAVLDYGVDMEMAAYIAKKLGKELVIKNMNFDAVCLSVGQHKCDIAMAGLTISEDRKEYVNFSDPYYEASQRLIVKGTDTTFDACKSADDVNAILNSLTEDKKIGCQQGTTGNSFIEGSNDLGFPGLKAKAVAYKNGSLAVQDLINNGVDYVIIDAAPAERIAKAINEMS